MISRRLLRIKVVKAMYAWLQTGGGDIKTARKQLRESIDATYRLYFMMLRLVVDVRDHAAGRIELGRAKHLPTPQELSPNVRFVENSVVRAIAENEQLAAAVKKHKLALPAELIRQLYDELVGSDFYIQYMSGGGNDLRVVKEFYSQIVQESDAVEETLEELSSLWSDDDRGMAVVMATKSLGASLNVLPQFRDESDEKFADRLFVEAVDGYDENLRMVESAAENWDVERIALMDNIIATTAVAEMRSMGTPAPVVMDEYIEIAKYYSGAASQQFINGILDKISKEI